MSESAGWRPDPDEGGRLRWFDGAVFDDDAAPIDAPVSAGVRDDDVVDAGDTDDAVVAGSAGAGEVFVEGRPPRTLALKVLVGIAVAVFAVLVTMWLYLIFVPAGEGDPVPESFVADGFEVVHPGIVPAIAGERAPEGTSGVFVLSTADDSAALVRVVPVDVGDGSVEELSADLAAELVETFSRVGTDVGEPEAVTLGGVDALRFSYTAEVATGVRDYVSVVALNGDEVFVVTFSAPETPLDSSGAENFESFLESFTFTG